MGFNNKKKCDTCKCIMNNLIHRNITYFGKNMSSILLYYINCIGTQLIQTPNGQSQSKTKYQRVTPVLPNIKWLWTIQNKIQNNTQNNWSNFTACQANTPHKYCTLHNNTQSTRNCTHPNNQWNAYLKCNKH